jgi:hypothetical protein
MCHYVVSVGTDVSEEHNAPIFRVQTIKQTNSLALSPQANYKEPKNTFAIAGDCSILWKPQIFAPYFLWHLI